MHSISLWWQNSATYAFITILFSQQSYNYYRRYFGKINFFPLFSMKYCSVDLSIERSGISNKLYIFMLNVHEICILKIFFWKKKPSTTGTCVFWQEHILFRIKIWVWYAYIHLANNIVRENFMIKHLFIYIKMCSYIV